MTILSALTEFETQAVEASRRHSVSIRYPHLALLVLTLFFAACSRPPELQVAGSSWLSLDRDGSAHDVIVYPLTEYELKWFEESLPKVESAAKRYPEAWAKIAEAEDPVFAASQGKFWKKCGLPGEDVIAVMLKITFLQEFSDTDETLEAGMRENLVWLEQRMKNAEATAELLQTADSIRAMLAVLDANRKAESFQYYTKNQKRIDAALDRFTSIVDQ